MQGRFLGSTNSGSELVTESIAKVSINGSLYRYFNLLNEIYIVWVKEQRDHHLHVFLQNVVVASIIWLWSPNHANQCLRITHSE